MARGRRGRSRPARGGRGDGRAVGGDTGGPAAGRYEIDTGTCELERDPFRPNAWVLKINGAESSHIDLDDPSELDFEYMRWFAAFITERWPGPAPLRMLHLGGGACTMARWAAATYRDARQVVVEIDGRLAELVRQWFDLPRAPRLRIRVDDAGEVLAGRQDGSRDVIIRDVFVRRTTPYPLITVETVRQAHRVLGPGGIYLVNCGDARDLRGVRAECAAMAAVFGHVALISDPAMLKGRRTGNVVIAGSDEPIGTDPALARDLLLGAVPAQVWGDTKVRRWCAGAAVPEDGGPDPRTEVDTLPQG